MSVTDIIRAGLEAGKTTSQIARENGLNKDTVRGVASRLRRRGVSAVADIAVSREDETVAQLRREIKRLKKSSLSEDEVREKIFALRDAPVAPPTWLKDVDAGSQMTGVPVIVCSDWHIGEVVDPDAIGGVNAYNSDIATARVAKLTEKVEELAMHHMVNPKYPGLVVCLGGDMITGEIHDELAKTNDEDVLVSVRRTRDLIVGMIRRWADVFGRVHAFCVSGNHGRTTRRIEGKGFVFKNLDWLVYTMVEDHFRDDGRVEMTIPTSNFCRFDIYDHRFALCHGHDLGVKGGDGIIGALGPILRGRIKIGAQQAAVGQDFDTLILGHWHQYIPMPRVIVNNCLKGPDEYSMTMLRADPAPASQSLFFVHPTYGVTARWEVFVDKPRTQRSSGPLSVWT